MVAWVHAKKWIGVGRYRKDLSRHFHENTKFILFGNWGELARIRCDFGSSVVVCYHLFILFVRLWSVQPFM